MYPTTHYTTSFHCRLSVPQLNMQNARCPAKNSRLQNTVPSFVITIIPHTVSSANVYSVQRPANNTALQNTVRARQQKRKWRIDFRAGSSKLCSPSLSLSQPGYGVSMSRHASHCCCCCCCSSLAHGLIRPAQHSAPSALHPFSPILFTPYHSARLHSFGV